ncbi:MAG: hypothetical protein ACFFB5_14740 [Promethearchaeota archaeon]
MQKIKEIDLIGNSLIKNHRDIHKLNHNKQNTVYRVFLYFFDEIAGHIPLFKYPSTPLNEKDRQILSIHSIWWHQDKFLTPFKFNSIDLELGGITYTATLFLCHTHRTRRRSGMDSTKWKPERFVLIVKIPSLVSFSTKELLFKLKSRIQGEIGEDLCFLVENYIKKTENSYVGDFIEKKSRAILKQLTSLCKSFSPKKNKVKIIAKPERKTIQDILINSDSREINELRFSIPKHKNN